jgi:hypothetical protein
MEYVTELLIELFYEEIASDMAAIALTIQDLSTRVSEVEGLGDIGYAVTPISELETLFDSHSDIEMTHDLKISVVMSLRLQSR